MSSVQAEVASAIAAKLNSDDAGLGLATPATWAYRIEYSLVELEQLRVTAIPGGMEWTRDTRAQSRNSLQISIVLQQRLGSPGDERGDIDRIVEMVEQIADYLLANYSPVPGVVLQSVETVPIPDEEHLVNQRVATCLVGATYRTMRAPL
jgi:hypothetical protein